MEIRLYTENDLERIKELYIDGRRRELATANLGNVIEFEKDKPKFEKFKKGKNIVAEVDGIIAGFICLNENEVSFLYVGNAYAGHGIGKKLLEVGIDELKNTIKEKEITLDLFKTNERAKALYKKLGFKESSEFIRNYDGEDKVVLHMELNI
ncbi:MAG: GNAT family N-acetyltransferase [Clostridium sp.]|uniref:GNAT family N-acetyltransferase n=1 Tax=Clostridium sp. TaxID=1506 RepID=UPI003EE47AA8